jgi:Na+/proline symporter
MHPLDYAVIAGIVLLMFAISLCFVRKASRSTEEFILAGRKMPWWLAGISVAATALNVNNVLQDTRKAREDGIGGMWFSWYQVIGQAIGAAWFFRLWRRAGFTTQMEFYLARYTGWQAHFSRLFDTVVYGGFVSLVWGALGLIGMKKVLHVLFDIPASFHCLGMAIPADWLIVTALVALSLTFTALSGVHGVVWADLVEFVIAMVSTYTLLFIVWHNVGWGQGLREHLATANSAARHSLNFLPPLGFIFLYYVLISPLLGVGGWSPSMQRYLCVKDEREVIIAAVTNSTLTLAARGVPFIIIGLAALFLVPDSVLLAKFPPIHTLGGAELPDRERIFPLLALQLMPAGLLGLTMGAFICAFITSLATNIHNSTAIFINDLYRAYIRPRKPDHHYVSAARFYMVAATVITILIGVMATNILALSMLTVAIVSAAGLVKFLRFLWWRINGSAEVAAQVASVIGIVFFLSPLGDPFLGALTKILHISGNDGFFVARQLILITLTLVTALITVWLTKPEPREHLQAFYYKVRPFGFWTPIKPENHQVEPDPIGLQFALAFSIIGAIFGIIFSMLLFFLGLWGYFLLASIVTVISWLAMYKVMDLLYPQTPIATESTQKAAIISES